MRDSYFNTRHLLSTATYTHPLERTHTLFYASAERQLLLTFDFCAFYVFVSFIILYFVFYSVVFLFRFNFSTEWLYLPKKTQPGCRLLIGDKSVTVSDIDSLVSIKSINDFKWLIKNRMDDRHDMVQYRCGGLEKAE